MIKNIIFDFGDIFIDLDKPATAEAMKSYGFKEITPELQALFNSYEKGEISTPAFLEKTQTIFPSTNKQILVEAWNAIIQFFPEHRLEFIEQLATQATYRLFLLSNTNALHIKKVQEHMGTNRYERFQKCFEQFYLSHEIHLRKPHLDIYEFVLSQNNLVATETLFIDDTKENTEAAQQLGIKVWNLEVGKEDIVDLKTKITLLC